MLIEVKVPVLAESVPDATLLEWAKQAGEAVERGENLIDLETDKVTLEVAAPESGVIKEILKQPGDVVLTDEVLAVIDTEGVASASTGGDAGEAPATADAAPAPEADATAPSAAAAGKLGP
ncbi:MAG: biotin/lipoyl-containing protein, partial [Gammaproteobacteria bacterium]